MYLLRSFLGAAPIRLGLLLLAIVAATSIWSGTEFVRAISSASQEEKAVATSKSLLRKLDSIRQRAPNVHDSTSSNQESISSVRRGLEFASIPEQSLEDIRYGQLNPVLPSQLFREDLTLVLRAVTLRQLMDFLSYLENDQSLGVCTAVQIGIDDRGQSDDAERWDLQLTLTRLTRSAKSPSVRR